jgi:hypothetical protein
MTEVEDLQYVGVFRPTTEPSLGCGVIHGLDESVAILSTIDAARAQLTTP